jgi:organic radical activating enzyme
MKGKISEIFSSIQGEGIYAGQRQVFARFAGCNISCSYCDTKFDLYREYCPDELLSEIESFGKGFHSISLTGGEPLYQKDFLKEILTLLKRRGHKTYLETNGTLPLALKEVINNVDIVAMDIKLPSSGDSHRGYWREHGDFLKISSGKDVFVKAVICHSTTQEDYLDMLNLLKSADYRGTLVLQPNSFEMDRLRGKLSAFKKYAQPYSFSARVIPQIHKLIGVR